MIRQARRRAGLTQAQLAARSGCPKSVISRWEHEKVEPSFRAVEEAVRGCGLELSSVLSEPEADPGDVALLDGSLAMSVSERLQRLIDFVGFVEAGRKTEDL